MSATQQDLVNVEGNLAGSLTNVEGNIVGSLTNVESNVLSDTKKIIENTTPPETFSVSQISDAKKELGNNLLERLLNIEGVYKGQLLTINIADSKGDQLRYQKGFTYNNLGEQVQEEDLGDNFLYNFAGTIKLCLLFLVHKLVEEGIFTLADTISQYIPDFDKSNIPLLDKYKNNNGTISVIGQDGTEVIIQNPDGTLPEPLETLKPKLKTISRDITINDMLYHTSGMVNNDLYSPIGYLYTNNTGLDYSSIVKTVLNYPNYLGVNVLSPGETILYDQSHLYLPGIISIIYNVVVNNIPVSIDMEDDPNFMNFSDIFEYYFGPAFNISKEDFQFKAYDNIEIAARSQPYISNAGRYLYFIPNSLLIDPNFLTELQAAKDSVGDTTPLLSTPIFPSLTAPTILPFPPGSPLLPGTSVLYTENSSRYPSGSNWEDISGRGATISINLISKISRCMINDGLDENGNQFLSKFLMSIKNDPVFPPGVYENMLNFVDGFGNSYNTQAIQNINFGILDNTYNGGVSLIGNTTATIDSGRYRVELGGSSTSNLILPGVASVLVSYNTLNFWYTPSSIIKGVIDTTSTLTGNLSMAKLVGVTHALLSETNATSKGNLNPIYQTSVPAGN
jgi:hypothetical protein